MEAAGVEPASTTIFTSGTTCLSSIKRFAVFFPTGRIQTAILFMGQPQAKQNKHLKLPCLILLLKQPARKSFQLSCF